ncbi:hypothetical protein BV375_06700 [Nostoc sp. 106C]|nr:hypothetical protein BV375_06700 [Nostoc sp. 106C]
MPIRLKRITDAHLYTRRNIPVHLWFDIQNIGLWKRSITESVFKNQVLVIRLLAKIRISKKGTTDVDTKWLPAGYTDTHRYLSVCIGVNLWFDIQNFDLCKRSIEQTLP